MPEKFPKNPEDFIDRKEKRDFQALTLKDLKEINKLEHALFRKIWSSPTHGFKKYTGSKGMFGTGEELDSDTIINSTMTANQVFFAMAMTRHPLIKELIKNPKITSENFEAEPFVTSKIMRGMKILDLGSSSKPVFARIARYMGADVWTVDLNPITNRDSDLQIPQELKEVERNHHIQLNLHDPRAIQILQEKTGGQFNLISEANLYDFRGLGLPNTKRIAFPLLKLGGVYSDTLTNPWLKEKDGLKRLESQ